MIKNFVTFGDSWPWGAELDANQNPFGYWIADDLGYEFEKAEGIVLKISKEKMGIKFRMLKTKNATRPVLHQNQEL